MARVDHSDPRYTKVNSISPKSDKIAANILDMFVDVMGGL